MMGRLYYVDFGSRESRKVDRVMQPGSSGSSKIQVVFENDVATTDKSFGVVVNAVKLLCQYL